jgi:hypothetical protein
MDQAALSEVTNKSATFGGLSRSINRVFARPRLAATLQGVALFIVFSASLALIQFATPAIVGNDGYYHIKFAELMRLEGLVPEFPYLPLTILSPQDFYDHHFLFHVLLIPFTFGDLTLGAKIASVLFASLAFMLVWWLFKSQRIPYAALWAVGLLVVSDAFLYRMEMSRAQTLSLGVLALGLYLLLERQYKWLIALGFFYVWLYNAFPLLLVLAACATAAILLIERRLELRPIIYSAIGIVAGLLINPYFPANIKFIYFHLTPKLLETTAVRVGSEWYPYTTGQLLENSLPAFVLFVLGFIALGMSDQKMSVKTATTMFTALVFGLMLFQSRRFIEYFPAFALIFAAFATAPLLHRTAQIKNSTLLDQQPSRFKRFLNPFPLVPLAGIVLLYFAFLWTVPRAQASVADTKPADLYQNAATYLAAVAPDGSMIFQTDWDDFTRLFFYNTQNIYLNGLDPTYLQISQPDLYEEWVAITRGDVDLPAAKITELFQAEFVFSDLNHKDFIRQADADPHMTEIYRDNYAVIYQIKP